MLPARQSIHSCLAAASKHDSCRTLHLDCAPPAVPPQPRQTAPAWRSAPRTRRWLPPAPPSAPGRFHPAPSRTAGQTHKSCGLEVGGVGWGWGEREEVSVVELVRGHACVAAWHSLLARQQRAPRHHIASHSPLLPAPRHKQPQPASPKVFDARHQRHQRGQRLLRPRHIRATQAREGERRSEMLALSMQPASCSPPLSQGRLASPRLISPAPPQRHPSSHSRQPADPPAASVHPPGLDEDAARLHEGGQPALASHCWRHPHP